MLGYAKGLVIRARVEGREVPPTSITAWLVVYEVRMGVEIYML